MYPLPCALYDATSTWYFVRVRGFVLVVFLVAVRRLTGSRLSRDARLHSTVQ